MILDGGLGTELERRGCDVTNSLWSARVLVENPELVEAVHFDYLCAGAGCITTASYQVSRSGFRRFGLTRNDTIRALQSSVAIAKQARDRFLAETTAATDANSPIRHRPLVAASIGPYGATLGDGSEYHGNYHCSYDTLLAFHRERIEILAAAGPDLLACETIPSMAEAEAMLRVVQDLGGEVPAWFSFSCRDDAHNCHGELLRDCASLFLGESGVAAIGLNCTPPHLVTALVTALAQELGAQATLPIIAYPNSGQTWDAAHRCWLGANSLPDIGTLAREWRNAGASWIGGCCGTQPRDIAHLRAALCASPTSPA